jgi:pyruvate dehydrogenase E2 component (dihydrolipoamide acetyltransferase)
MAYDFKLPDVGDGIEEAEVLKWMVDVGDGVLEDDPIAEVETERAIIEIPSPVDGTVRRFHSAEGETVGVGDRLVTFETGKGTGEARNDGGVEILDSDGNAAVNVDADGGEEGPVDNDRGGSEVSEATRRLAREIGVDIDDVEGSGEGGRIVAQDILHAAKEDQDERDREREEGSDPEEEDEDGSGTGIPGKGGKTPAMEDDDSAPEFGQSETPAVEPDTAEETSMFGDETPVAERTDETDGADEEDETEEEAEETKTEETEVTEPEEGARDRDTTAETESGTEADAGEGTEDTARAERADTERTPGTEITPTASDEGTSGPVDVSSEGTAEPETDEVGDEDESTETVTDPFGGEDKGLMTHHDVADAERLAEAREAMNESVDGRLGYTPLLVKACSEALRDHPGFRDGDEGDGVDIGVAVETDEDVAVVVVEEADLRGVVGIAEDIEEAVEGAKENEGGGAEDAAFALVNVGAVGGDGVSPVVDKPGTAALSVGEIRRRATVVDEEVVARHTAPLHLTFDGTVNAAEAARLTNDIKRCLREPAVMLL